MNPLHLNLYHLVSILLYKSYYYLQCHLYIQVVNPVNLPLKINCWTQHFTLCFFFGWIETYPVREEAALGHGPRVPCHQGLASVISLGVLNALSARP